MSRITGIVRTRAGGEVRPLSPVAVYVTELPGEATPPPKEPVVMHVNGGRFEPPHVCVRVGQSLLIEQEDDDPHMIDVVSRFRAGGGRALPPDKSRRQTEVFSKPENGVILRCAVHFQERACVTVVPNAFHTMTGADGTFQLPGALPPGKYTLCAFHAELGRWLGEIEVPGDGSPVNVEIWYDPPPGPEGDK